MGLNFTVPITERLRTGIQLFAQKFSEGVLQRSVSAVKNYWQQMIFSGRDVPPAELGTDDEVVKYVTTHKGSIGYVSAGAALG